MNPEPVFGKNQVFEQIDASASGDYSSSEYHSTNSTLTNKVRVEQSGGIAVFNFTVEGNHNYFVLAKDFGYGQSCVLVHNSCYSWFENPTPGGRNISNHALEDSLVRHKFTSSEEIDNIIDNFTYTRADGLGNTAYIQKCSNTDYKVVILNEFENRIVTANQFMTRPEMVKMLDNNGFTF